MIQIQVTAYNDLPLPQPVSATFDESGGNIGRSEDNLLVLHDPGKNISRIHAVVSFQGGQYFIRGLGSALPVYLNDQALTNGLDVPISGNDRIGIGGYVMRVVSNHTDSVMNMMPGEHFSVPSDYASDGQSLADLLAFPSGDKPQDPVAPSDQMGEMNSAADWDPFAVDPMPPVSADIIPPDFDPFAEFSPMHDALPEVAPSGSGSSEILDPILASKDKQPGIDAFINPDYPLMNLHSSPGMADNLAGSGSIDSFVVMGDSPDYQAMARSPFHDDASELQAALPAMHAAREKEAAVTDSSGMEKKVSAKKPDDGYEGLLQAFFAGAGIEPGQSLALTPQLMNLIGRLLRESTQGTLDLLQARTLTKREIQAEMTMIAPKENNPLKFSPDVEAALTHLLMPRGQGGQGFMQPVQAMQDAYDDLRIHQFGFMAGMRAALSAVLEHFSPDQLQQRLTQKTVFDSLFPMNHRAKLWDLFIEQYDTISREAQEDFHVMFGREFLRAYEAQIARLGKGGREKQ